MVKISRLVPQGIIAVCDPLQTYAYVLGHRHSEGESCVHFHFGNFEGQL